MANLQDLKGRNSRNQAINGDLLCDKVESDLWLDCFK